MSVRSSAFRRSFLDFEDRLKPELRTLKRPAKAGTTNAVLGRRPENRRMRDQAICARIGRFFQGRERQGAGTMRTDLYTGFSPRIVDVRRAHRPLRSAAKELGFLGQNALERELSASPKSANRAGRSKTSQVYPQACPRFLWMKRGSGRDIVLCAKLWGAGSSVESPCSSLISKMSQPPSFRRPAGVTAFFSRWLKLLANQALESLVRLCVSSPGFRAMPPIAREWPRRAR
jgi:hypothetical protein